MKSNTSESRPTQIIPLWPVGAPGSENWEQQEQEMILQMPDSLKVIRNVTQPSLTVYLPETSTATGTAVIVCPGGAWHFLSIDLEGTDIAHWLQSRGITAFILKYRLLRTGEDILSEIKTHLSDSHKMDALMKPLRPLILADGQQAVRLVRQRATEWGIDPQRIGMMGFSAGGMLTGNIALQHDSESRPDFSALIYSAPCEAVPVPEDAPPLFLLCAADDDMASGVSTQLYAKWRASGHPVEMHIFSKGGHGFGLRQQGLPSDTWIERFADWLQMLNPQEPFISPG